MKIINKDRWEPVLLGTVAKKVNRKINPLELGIKRRIGGENFISSDLKIRTWGVVGETYLGPAFYMHVIPGDILYVSRNAHLRKVALADFEAVCANTTFIVRAEETMLLQDLLKHIMLSDSFTEFAISSSKGSTNPFINWKDVEKYKFLLPPLEEQKQISALFQSIETAMEQVDGQEKNLKGLWLRLINEFVSDNPSFGNLIKGKKLQTVNYSDVTEKIMRRISPESYGIEKIIGGEHLNAEDFKIRTWDTVGIDSLGPAFHVLFKPGDILYGSRRTYLKKVAFAEFEGVCANTTYVIRANEELLLQDLLKHIMLSERFTQYSIGVSKGSTNPYINWKDLDNFSFQIPNIEIQKEIVKVLDSIIEIREQLKQQKTTLKNLKQKLLNEILG